MSPIALFIYIIACLLIAMSWAEKKRIGGTWGLFFLVFTSIIIGCIVISMSPNKSRIKEMKDGFYGWDKIIGWLTAVLCALAFYNLISGGSKKIWYTDEQNNIETVRSIFFILGTFGISYYMFTRFKRHEQLYNEANKGDNANDENEIV